MSTSVERIIAALFLASFLAVSAWLLSEYLAHNMIVGSVKMGMMRGDRSDNEFFYRSYVWGTRLAGVVLAGLLVWALLH